MLLNLSLSLYFSRENDIHSLIQDCGISIASALKISSPELSHWYSLEKALNVLNLHAYLEQAAGTCVNQDQGDNIDPQGLEDHKLHYAELQQVQPPSKTQKRTSHSWAPPLLTWINFNPGMVK